MSRRLMTAALAAAALAAGCGGGGGGDGDGSDGRNGVPLPRDGASGPTRYVAPSGDDDGPGTAQQPWRSLAAAVEKVEPGTTIELRPGSYGERGELLDIETEDITVTGGTDGPRPTVLGAVKVTAPGVRLHRLRFQGPTGAVLERTDDNPNGEEVQVSVEADRVEILDCEVRDNAWHAGIYISEAEDVRLVGNHIHDNGGFDRPEQANLDHGIYFGSGSGLVANNVVERNLTHGIQLYPRARGVVVAFNTIAANGKSGVIVGEDAAENLIMDNVIVDNRGNSVRSSGLDGDGNVVRRNLIWGNGSGNLGTQADDLVLEDNVQADPRFEKGYRLGAKSPALDAGRALPGITTDARGVRRPQGEGFDLGAFERP